jgi:hypothetical protein
MTWLPFVFFVFFPFLRAGRRRVQRDGCPKPVVVHMPEPRCILLQILRQRRIALRVGTPVDISSRLDADRASRTGHWKLVLVPGNW